MIVLSVLVARLRKRSLLSMAEDLNGHTRGSAEEYKGQRGDYVLGVSSKEDGRILKFCVALVT